MKKPMNRIEFYNKLSKFREYHELTHAGVDRSNDSKTTISLGKGNTSSSSSQRKKYYTKIDNYYSDGSARYFYSKDEYDAYLKQKADSKNKWDEAVKQKKEEEAKKAEEEKRKAEEAAKQKAIQDNYRKNQEAAQKAEAEKAAKAKENARIEANKSKWNEAVKEKKEKDEYQEKALSYSQKMEEQMRKKEEYSDWKTAQLDKQKEEYKNASDKEIRKQCDDLRAAFNDVYNGNPDSLKKLDNETLDLFLEWGKMSKSDLNDILAPIWNSGFGPKVRQDKDILDKLTDMVDKMESAMRSDVGHNTTYKDAKKDMTYLKDKKQKIIEKKEKAIDNAVNTEMENARTSLEKIYNGDSKNLKLDAKLRKKLEEKLEEIDPDYEKGTLYKYVRPYILGKWYRDDESYANVLQALEELEKELNNKNNRNEAYADFIEDVLNNM